ncbi:MAG TPA: cyclic nucleotide-binding domain-containing protein [Marinobacter sp.]|nr:cyclic nucleotide-binding domain-containing protein [Marinobacter sp.]
MVTYNAKSAVFMQQAPFTSFFVVKSGSVKSIHVNERGDERILGFYFPGELFGLDGLTNGTYGCTALALERSMICRLNMDRLEELGAKLPQVQHYRLSRRASRRKILPHYRRLPSGFLKSRVR